MAKITPIRVTEQFEHFLKEMKESFWGDLYGKTRLAWKKFWDAQSLRERDSYMKTGWYDQVEPEQAHRLPERILRAGLRDAFGDDPAADRADARKELPSERVGKVRATCRGCGDSDSRGVSARDLHAPGGPSGGDDDRRAGECADGFQTHPRSGRRGSAVSFGRVARTNGPICFWME